MYLLESRVGQFCDEYSESARAKHNPRQVQKADLPGSRKEGRDVGETGERVRESGERAARGTVRGGAPQGARLTPFPTCIISHQ